MHQPAKDLAVPAHAVPVIGTWDVLVAGGGMAGIGAACAAARAGARVLLVERLEVLGGLATSGGVGNFCYGDASLPAAQGAVLLDVWQALHARRAMGPDNGWHVQLSPPFYNWTFDHQVLALVLQDLAESDGVDLLFATDIAGGVTEGPTLTAALLHNRSLLQAARARVFIDATGDGVLARHAGAAPLPPEPEHPGSIPPSHMLFMQRSERPAPPPEPGPAPAGAAPPKYSVWREPDRIGLKMFYPGREFDTATGAGYSEAGRAFRRRIPEYVAHFRATEAGRQAAFAFSAPMLGLRDSVRVEGDYVLTADDLRAGRRFEDAVAHGCFPLDSGAIRKDPMPPYQIPYRSLLAKGLENVLVAGRCISATRVALASTRVMVTGCLMGQAAGHAAAQACRQSVPVRQIPAAAIRAALLAAAGHEPALAERLGAG